MSNHSEYEPIENRYIGLAAPPFDPDYPVTHGGINAEIPGAWYDPNGVDFVPEDPRMAALRNTPKPPGYDAYRAANPYDPTIDDFNNGPYYDTREAWLDAFVMIMRPRLAALNYFVPVAIRVSIGFPSKGGLSRTRKKLFEVWPTEASKDGSLEIFISPVVSDPMEALVTLTGGLGYAIVGNNDKEGFTKYCKALGLGGKPSTLFAGDELKGFLEKKLEELGTFPGAALDPDAVIKDVTDKKPGSRMLKVTCPGPECDYLVRTSKTCILRGLPVCPCGLTMVGPDFDANGDVIPEVKQ